MQSESCSGQRHVCCLFFYVGSLDINISEQAKIRKWCEKPQMYKFPMSLNIDHLLTNTTYWLLFHMYRSTNCPLIEFMQHTLVVMRKLVSLPIPSRKTYGWSIYLMKEFCLSVARYSGCAWFVGRIPGYFGHYYVVLVSLSPFLLGLTIDWISLLKNTIWCILWAG